MPRPIAGKVPVRTPFAMNQIAHLSSFYVRPVTGMSVPVMALDSSEAR